MINTVPPAFFRHGARYYWIPITHRPGSLAGPTPYAGGPVSVITAAPHSNLIDAILFYYTSFPAVVSMAANGRVPIMGDIMKVSLSVAKYQRGVAGVCMKGW